MVLNGELLRYAVCINNKAHTMTISAQTVIFESIKTVSLNSSGF